MELEESDLDHKLCFLTELANPLDFGAIFDFGKRASQLPEIIISNMLRRTMNTTQESLAKAERENRLSIELLTSQVQQLQSDNERLQSDVERLRSKNEKVHHR